MRLVQDGTDTLEYLDIGQAAARLGTTVEALRKRIRRGTVRAVKRDGHWMVVLDASRTRDVPDTSLDNGPDSRTVSVQPPRDELVAWFQAELDRRSAQLEGALAQLAARDAIIASLVEQTARITAPEASAPAPQGRRWWAWWRKA